MQSELRRCQMQRCWLGQQQSKFWAWMQGTFLAKKSYGPNRGTDKVQEGTVYRGTNTRHSGLICRCAIRQRCRRLSRCHVLCQQRV